MRKRCPDALEENLDTTKLRWAKLAVEMNRAHWWKRWQPGAMRKTPPRSVGPDSVRAAHAAAAASQVTAQPRAIARTASRFYFREEERWSTGNGQSFPLQQEATVTDSSLSAVDSLPLRHRMREG